MLLRLGELTSSGCCADEVGGDRAGFRAGAGAVSTVLMGGSLEVGGDAAEGAV